MNATFYKKSSITQSLIHATKIYFSLPGAISWRARFHPSRSGWQGQGFILPLRIHYLFGGAKFHLSRGGWQGQGFFSALADVLSLGRARFHLSRSGWQGQGFFLPLRMRYLLEGEVPPEPQWVARARLFSALAHALSLGGRSST